MATTKIMLLYNEKGKDKKLIYRKSDEVGLLGINAILSNRNVMIP